MLKKLLALVLIIGLLGGFSVTAYTQQDTTDDAWPRTKSISDES